MDESNPTLGDLSANGSPSLLGWDVEGLPLLETLVRSGQLMKLFFELPLIGMAVTCPETKRWIFFNDRLCELFGYPRSELSEIPWSQLTHPLDMDKDLAQFERVMQGLTDGYSMDKRFIHKDGRVIWARNDVKCIRKPDGTVEFFLALVQDISDRKQLEEQRREIERKSLDSHKFESLGLFAAAIGHEFNNALLTILGHADLFARETAPTSPGRAHLEEIIASARGASQLCHEMLLYSGTGSPKVQVLDLSVLIDDITKFLQTCVSKRAVLKFNLARHLPPVKGDPDQVRQLILNTVINASESLVANRGTITLSTGADYCERSRLDHFLLGTVLDEGTYVWLKVSDTGSGMDEATRDRAFEPFFSTRFGARGLGMAAVMGIVRNHAGAIELHSELGQGTSVRFFLPAAEEEPVDASGGHTETEDQPLMERTILLVDDDESVLKVGKLLLESLGCTVLTAGGGVRGLEIYRDRRHEIDCVILDMTMSDLTGEDTLLALRHVEPEVRVILSSGYPKGETGDRLAAMANVWWLAKPYGRGNLEEALRKALPA